MPSKIKVLQVIPKLGYGGAETGCYDIAHYLHEKDFGSYVVTSGGDLLKYVNKKKVKVIRLPVHSKNPLLILINAIILSLIIIFLNIDIVHARSRAPAWSCYFATRITRRKFVTTFHGTYNFKSPIKKFYNSVMLKSDLIICGSNFIFSHIYENYKDYIHNKKLLVIFRGINLEYFNGKNVKEEIENKLLSEHSLDKSKKIILLPGRLTAWKGQEMFIEAIKNLKLIRPDILFTAVLLGNDQGRKIYKKKLQRLVEQYRLVNDVKFIEHIKHMPSIYNLSHIVISSSIEPEAFGRVSVEGQAMEKIVIASNIGGSNETIVDKKSGYLFEAGNSEDLLKKLIFAIDLDFETANKIKDDARNNVIRKFDVEKMCFSTYSEYKKLLN
jgi:glycosyltransferase involved in cell wall biosynthesis|tara:strand:+ start:2195 stop:3346 length:1152 start_codon:yes stop_codon:yes gene_type:complete